VRLYVSDFDKNGHTDQLLSYTENGKEYPFLAKDEMERALPVLRKHYLLYAEYAGLQMKDVFYGFAEQVQPLSAERLGSAVCYGDGNGGFTLSDLPVELQLAPVFSFQKAGRVGNENRYLAAGNFFEVIPYEGRYDAQAAALFSISKERAVVPIHDAEVAQITGQLRDLKWLRTAAADSFLVMARNNDRLLFYKARK
jgi:hypothetical protein